MKKIAIIGASILILLLIIFGVFISREDTKFNGTLPSEEGGAFPSERADTSSDTKTGGKSTTEGQGSTKSGGGQVFPGGNSEAESGGAVLGKNVKKIWDKPIVGATMYGSLKNGTLTARFMEAGTGHIYDYNIPSGLNRRVSGATIPRVQSVTWGNQGQSLIFRYVDNDGIVKNYSARISAGTSTENQLVGHYIQRELGDIGAGPKEMEKISCLALLTLKLEKGGRNDQEEVRRLQRFLAGQGVSTVKETGIFDEETWKAVVAFQELYASELLIPNGLTKGNGLVGPATRKKINELHCEKEGQTVNGGLIAYIEKSADTFVVTTSEFSDANRQSLSLVKVGELRISWPEKNTLMISSKPNSQSGGYLFSLPASGLTTKPLADVATPILRNVRGITVSVDHKANKIIYGEAGPSRYTSKILDRASGVTRSFPLNTIPSEKCAWDPNRPHLVYCAGPKQGLGSNEPESWYLGLTKNQDNIYSIDTETDTVSPIYNPEGGGPDVEHIQISDDSSIILFVDKTDSSPWIISMAKL